MRQPIASNSHRGLSLNELTRNRPGPIVMSLLFAPFWVGPLAFGRAPQRDDATITASLIEHLVQMYPVPRPLHQPWFAEGLPSSTWVCRLVLLGQSGNLRGAARRFGGSIARRFTQHFSTAPAELTVVEACMWAEIARRGGDRVDFERVGRDPAFAIDTTEDVTSIPELPDDQDPTIPRWQRQRHEVNEQTRSFWRQTVEWVIQRRAELTDESCAIVLEWAMHLHTEGARPWPAPPSQLTWSGREPAGSHAGAVAYRRARETLYGDRSWTKHGLGWDSRESDGLASTVRELTSSGALGEGSRAMHPCVASYAHLCARGKTAIFSIRADAIRKVTVELDPFRRRAVQVRGLCNRAATPPERGDPAGPGAGRARAQ